MNSKEVILYPIKDLVFYLNQMTCSEIVVTVDSIKNPEPNHIHSLYYLLLKEIGFTGLSVVRTLEQLGLDKLTKEATEADLLKDCVMTDTLCAACRIFFSKVGGYECDFRFGLLDLVDPKPDRLRKFLSVIVNFYLFCNNNYGEAEQSKSNAQIKAQHKNSLESEISKCVKSIEDLRLSKGQDEMKAEKMRHDLSQMDAELEELVGCCNQNKLNAEIFKGKLVELAEQESALTKCLQQLEKDEKRLRLLAKIEERRIELESEQRKPSDEYEAVLDHQEFLQNSIADLDRKEKEIEALIKLVKDLKRRGNVVQPMHEDVKSSEDKIASARKSLSDHETDLLQIEKKTSDLKLSMMSVSAKWEKRKPAMKADLEELGQQMELINQQISENDLISTDLFERIEQTKRAIRNEDRLLNEENSKIKQIFGQIKSALENVICQKSEIEKAFEACNKLDAYKS